MDKSKRHLRCFDKCLEIFVIFQGFRINKYSVNKKIVFLNLKVGVILQLIYISLYLAKVQLYLMQSHFFASF